VNPFTIECLPVCTRSSCLPPPHFFLLSYLQCPPVCTRSGCLPSPHPLLLSYLPGPPDLYSFWLFTSPHPLLLSYLPGPPDCTCSSCVPPFHPSCCPIFSIYRLVLVLVVDNFSTPSGCPICSDLPDCTCSSCSPPPPLVVLSLVSTGLYSFLLSTVFPPLLVVQSVVSA